MKIWTCESSPQSGSRNAWTRNKNVNGVNRLRNFGFFMRYQNDFLLRLVTMDETWLYHYDPETKQQSMEWRHSGWPRPKISKCKNLLENFSPRFFGIKTASCSLIIFKRAELSTQSIIHLCWCNWKIFLKEKRLGKVTKKVMFLHDLAPAHWALALQTKLAYLDFYFLWSPTLFSVSGPVGLQPVPRIEKKIKSSPFSSDAEVIAAADVWLNGHFSDFCLSGLQKLEQRAKKCIELRGEYVE